MSEFVSIVPDRLAHYRVPVFNNIAKNCAISMLTVYADLTEDSTGIEKPTLSELEGMAFRYGNSKDFRVRGRLLLSSGSIKAAFDKSGVIIVWGDAFCPGNWLSLFLAKLRSKKVVFWTHGLYGNEGFLKAHIRCLFYSMADSLILYGEHSKRLLLDKGFDGRNIFVVNNALDFDAQNSEYIKNDGKRTISEDFELNLIFVGRLTSVKKLDQIILAVSKLCSCYSINLDLVGDGPEVSSLKSYADHLGVTHLVNFHGPIYDEAVLAPIIMRADIMVSPGNVGLTAMHSLIYGTPVVTHSNGCNQMPEYEAVRPGVSGELFDEGDFPSLVEAIVRCKNNIISGRISESSCRNVIMESYSFEYQSAVINECLGAGLSVK